MYKAGTLAGGIHEPLLTCSSSMLVLLFSEGLLRVLNFDSNVYIFPIERIGSSAM